MGEWRNMPPIAKLLVILVALNTLMLAYDTDFLYHINQLIHGL